MLLLLYEIRIKSNLDELHPLAMKYLIPLNLKIKYQENSICDVKPLESYNECFLLQRFMKSN